MGRHRGHFQPMNRVNIFFLTPMNKLLDPSPIRLSESLAVARIAVGLLTAYHGLEVFDSSLMEGYMSWDAFSGPAAAFMVYAGKSSELIAGLLLTFGLLTRLGGVMLAGTLSYVTFFVGQGRFWYEDQHPFMFVLFGLLFALTGPGAWSLDARLFGSGRGR